MDAKMEVKAKRSKKGAMIFIIVMLVLLAISIPLLFIDLDALFTKIPEREITYYTADFGSSVWDSEEYASHFPLYLTISEDGHAHYETAPFSNAEEAEKSFAEAKNYKYGASVVADYFYAAFLGCDSSEEEETFKELFTEDYEDEIPLFFPPQKVYNIKMVYQGKGEEDKTAVWRVSFDVVRNDGTVFNYTGARDGGEARIYLKEVSDGIYRIEDIIGIVKVN